MSFWSRVFGTGEGVTPNENGPADYNPGDPDGFALEGEDTYSRSLPFPQPSPWSGWPSNWSTQWGTTSGLNKLIDAAWGCIDLNSSVLAGMPPYRLRSGQIVDSPAWMLNPDPLIYSSWFEFAKQLFWDFQLGEVFVLPMARGADGWPLRFRVIPGWLINVEMRGGTREYRIGLQDVTDDILHIRYQSASDDAHGHGSRPTLGRRLYGISGDTV